jgi:hypothetical protein
MLSDVEMAIYQGVHPQKENIEWHPATRCFPEGRKSFSAYFVYRQESDYYFNLKNAISPTSIVFYVLNS